MNRIFIIFFIFILAFSARFITITVSADRLEMDENEYERLAMNLAQSKGYINSSDGLPTSLRPPLYPMLMALIYKITGPNHYAIRLVQALAGSVAVILLYLTAYKIFNQTTAILAGLFASFYMTFVACTRFLHTETFFMFLLVSIVYLVMTTPRSSGLFRYCVLGLACGFLTLLRSTASLVPFIIIAFFMVKTHKLGQPMKKGMIGSLILLFFFVLVLAPWTIRNYRIWARPVIVSTNGGMNFYQGLIRSKDRIFDLDSNSEIAVRANTISNEAQRSSFYIEEAIKIYKSHPLFTLKMIAIKILFFWNIIDWEILGGNIINYQYIFILPFALFGIAISFKNKKDILFPLLIALYFSSFAIIFPGTPRYRMPIDGYLIMAGCYGIYEFIKGQRNKFYPLLGVGSYFLLTYLAYIYSFQVKYAVRSFAEMIGLW